MNDPIIVGSGGGSGGGSSGGSSVGGAPIRIFNTSGQNQPMGDYSPETSAELARQERRRQIATMLMQQGLEGGPAYQKAGRFIVPRGWASGVGDFTKVLTGAIGHYQSDTASREAIDKETTERKLVIETLRKQLAPTPASKETTEVNTNEDYNRYIPAQPERPASIEKVQQALLDAAANTRDPKLLDFINRHQQTLDRRIQRQDTETFNRQTINENRSEKEAARKMQDQQKRDLVTQQIDAKSDLQRERLEAQSQMQKDRLVGMAQNKLLPVGALKEANDIVDISNGVGLVNTQIQRHLDHIKNGTLDLGLWKNWVARGRNLAGLSDEQSNAFAQFTRDIEKARGAILLAAKGIQTEGDATRALDQIIDSKNDPKIVAQALQDMIDNNNVLKKAQDAKLNFLYINYNVPPEKQMQLATQDGGAKQPAPNLRFDAQGNPVQ